MIGPQPPRSSLARVIESEPDPERAWRLCEQAWHEHGIALLNPAEVERRKGWVAARLVRNLAEQCFGKRREGSQ